MEKYKINVGLAICVSLCVVCNSCDTGTSQPKSSAISLYEVETEKEFPCELCGGGGLYRGYVCGRCGGAGRVVSNYVETRSSSNISFKGASYYYGSCNNPSCECKLYKHKPGQTACINCELYECTNNKFGHKKVR